jgi:hypothetical protein
MPIHELRDADAARLFLAEGLWFQRVAAPKAATASRALAWALELAASGEPLPPVGLVADAGHVAFHMDREAWHGREATAVPGWPATAARAYEDYVLGKVYADWSFSRAADALSRYQGRDRARGLAFLLEQLRRRAGFGGVVLSPSVVKAALERPPEEVLAEGWEALERDGPSPLLAELYDELIAAVRNTAELLGPEDVFELEHGTALAQFGQRVALRQVLQAAAELEAGLAKYRSRPPARKHEVPTRLIDEDSYPVGGFASIATRGSVESLLHSQLAYMERDERPDLFDIKFLRDELLYYSRDENQFLRRRRTFVFALHPDLVRARFKDAELPRQRIVLLLALLLVSVRKLTEWLSSDALSFEFLFLQEDKDDPLAAEQALVEMLLREQVANGTVATSRLPAPQLAAFCDARGRRSLCHCLAIATTDRAVPADAAIVTRLRLDGPRPAIGVDDEPATIPEADDAPTSWGAALEALLPLWV